MQPPSDPNPQRSFLAQLLMNIFNRGQPFSGVDSQPQNLFPAAPGSGLSGLFPAAPAGPPTDMSLPGPWGAGIDPATTAATPATVPTPTPRPQTLPRSGPVPPPKSLQRPRR